MSENGVLTAERIMATRRVRVETSIGVVVVRPVGYAELAELTGMILDVSTLAVDGQASKADRARLVTSPQGRATLKGLEAVVRASVVEPELGTDPKAGPVVSDFTVDDQLAIFTRVLALSGYTREAGAAVLP